MKVVLFVITFILSSLVFAQNSELEGYWVSETEKDTLFIEVYKQNSKTDAYFKGLKSSLATNRKTPLYFELNQDSITFFNAFGDTISRGNLEDSGQSILLLDESKYTHISKKDYRLLKKRAQQNEKFRDQKLMKEIETGEFEINKRNY